MHPVESILEASYVHNRQNFPFSVWL